MARITAEKVYLDAGKPSTKRMYTNMPTLGEGRGSGGWWAEPTCLLHDGSEKLERVLYKGNVRKRRAVALHPTAASSEDINDDLIDLGLREAPEPSPEPVPQVDLVQLFEREIAYLEPEPEPYMAAPEVDRYARNASPPRSRPSDRDRLPPPPQAPPMRHASALPPPPKPSWRAPPPLPLRVDDVGRDREPLRASREPPLSLEPAHSRELPLPRDPRDPRDARDPRDPRGSHRLAPPRRDPFAYAPPPPPRERRELAPYPPSRDHAQPPYDDGYWYRPPLGNFERPPPTTAYPAPGPPQRMPPTATSEPWTDYSRPKWVPPPPRDYFYGAPPPRYPQGSSAPAGYASSRP